MACVARIEFQAINSRDTLYRTTRVVGGITKTVDIARGLVPLELSSQPGR